MRLPSAALVAIALVIVGLGPSAAGAVGADPTMSISPAVVTHGQVLTVSIEGWPAGSATARVCANAALRGAEDCDLAGERIIEIRSDGTGSTLIQADPPGDCPCVVRVSTPRNELVQLLDLTVVGWPLSGAAGGGTVVPKADQIVVDAKVMPSTPSWGAAFGTRTERTLEVTVRNTGVAPVSGLTLDAAVRRDGSSGDALTSPAIGALGPGEERSIAVPFVVGPPAIGRDVVYGELLGLDRPIPFRTSTDNQPWALYILALVAVVTVVGTAAWKPAKRHQARPSSPSTRSTT